jgi:hypothetical protein
MRCLPSLAGGPRDVDRTLSSPLANLFAAVPALPTQTLWHPLILLALIALHTVTI